MTTALKDVILLVVKLQHQCKNCGRYLRQANHYRLKESSKTEIKSRSGKPLLVTKSYFCQACASQLPSSQQQFLEAEPAILTDTTERNPLIVCRMFESRQMFMTNCQFNHYQFNQVRRRNIELVEMMMNRFVEQFIVQPLFSIIATIHRFQQNGILVIKYVINIIYSNNILMMVMV